MQNQKEYTIQMEIAGPFAIWARPDTGSTPTSYPIPTYSATKGIFESVAFLKDSNAWIRPTRVEICKSINAGEDTQGIYYQKYTTNYQGILKEPGARNFQFSALILTDVCYRLYAVIENGSGRPLAYGNNPSHHLQEMFNRRLIKGQCYKTPCLGWSEFTASYWGLLRDENNLLCAEKTIVNEDINLNLISVLKQVFDKPVSGKYSPTFLSKEDARIVKGVFNYD